MWFPNIPNKSHGRYSTEYRGQKVNREVSFRGSHFTKSAKARSILTNFGYNKKVTDSPLPNKCLSRK